MTSQSEFYYKSKLQQVIEKWMQDCLNDDHDLGYMPDEMTNNMAEAAWLIIKANKDIQVFLEEKIMR